MSNTERAGGCLCGNVRYVARGEPIRVGVCHCTTCQKNTGSAFLAFAVFRTEQVALEGTLATFKAPTVARRFCPACGSLVVAEDEPGETDIAIGSFDTPPDFALDYELFVGRRHPWLPPFPGVRRFAGNRDGEPLP